MLFFLFGITNYSHSHFSCMFMGLTDKKFKLWYGNVNYKMFELQYFISVYHTDLLNEKFHPSFKTVGQARVLDLQQPKMDSSLPVTSGGRGFLEYS